MLWREWPLGGWVTILNLHVKNVIMAFNYWNKREKERDCVYVWKIYVKVYFE